MLIAKATEALNTLSFELQPCLHPTLDYLFSSGAVSISLVFSSLSPQVAIKIIDKTQLNPNSLQKVIHLLLGVLLGWVHLEIHQAQQIGY